MMDLGLTKIVVIGVVALVVIGPEKLPKVMRLLGTLYGRAQRYLRDVKAEVSREIDVEALRNMHKDVLDKAGGVQATVDGIKTEVESALSVQEREFLGTGHGQPEVHLSDWESSPMQDDTEYKARQFRRKKMGRTTAVPVWYKNRQRTRQQLLSGAARVKMFRTTTKSDTSFF